MHIIPPSSTKLAHWPTQNIHNEKPSHCQVAQNVHIEKKLLNGPNIVSESHFSLS
jgi:hypothetical protein